jgi:hypothetical protein
MVARRCQPWCGASIEWELLTTIGAGLVGVGFVGILMMSLIAR